VEKARRLLAWEARVDLEDGIAQTVEWLRQQRHGADGSAGGSARYATT
jgi:nucleoside-diphosphate-sugar epimerase